jgi:hypothetical protein
MKGSVKIMTKLLSTIITLGIISIWAPSSFAAAASKFAAHLSSATLIPKTNGTNWATLLHTTIKTPNKKDLLLGGSLVTSLFTTKKKVGASETKAEIQVRILVDGNEAEPGVVVYDKRIEKLTIELAPIVQSCVDTCTFDATDPMNPTCLPPPDGIITVQFECGLATEQTLDLFHKTAAAHHFNFVAANLNAGVHDVELQARVVTFTDDPANTAEGYVGKGSLTVEEVKAANGPGGIEF